MVVIHYRWRYKSRVMIKLSADICSKIQINFSFWKLYQKIKFCQNVCEIDHWKLYHHARFALCE